MPIEGVGIDFIEVERISRLKDNRRFLERCFTTGEIEYCLRKRFPEQSLAARFAAKEAVGKALGSGVGNRCLRWKDVEIVRTTGKPSVVIHGLMSRALTRASFQLSLTHTKTLAGAIVTFKCESADRGVFDEA